MNESYPSHGVPQQNPMKSRYHQEPSCQHQNMADKEHSTIVVNAGKSRRYYFDIKESKGGEKYLQITDYSLSRRRGTKIVVWHDHATEFYEGLQEAMAGLRF